MHPGSEATTSNTLALSCWRPASSGAWEGRGPQGFRLLNQRGRYASELGCCFARLGLKLKPGDLSGEDVALAIMKQQVARARTPASQAGMGPKRSGKGKAPQSLNESIRQARLSLVATPRTTGLRARLSRLHQERTGRQPFTL